jgi:hypothetical protein
VPVTFAFTDPAEAGTVIPLFNHLVPPEADMFPAAQRAEWFADVADVAARGEFLTALTIWVASARQPAAACQPA